MRSKSGWITAVLAVLFGLATLLGAGHFYLGKWRRGAVFLVAGLALLYGGTLLVVLSSVVIMNAQQPRQHTGGWEVLAYVFIGGALLWLIYLVIFIWHCIDARRLCKEHNQRVIAAAR